jgi:hypothetical protein
MSKGLRLAPTSAAAAHLETDRMNRSYLDQEINADAFGRFFRPIEEWQKQVVEEIPKLQADHDSSLFSSLF